jgi:hypothetical protein
MKAIVRFLALGVMLAGPGASFAGGWTNAGTVAQIHLTEGKDGILIKHQLMTNSDACARTDYFTLKLI